MHIANKTVLITGANRGIGAALVDEMLYRGAKRVYAGSRSVHHHHDERVVVLKMDITEEDDIRRAVEMIGHLDILINNAGIFMPDDLGDKDIIDRHLAVNFFGTLKVTQACLPALIESQGFIVNNLSLSALAPVASTPAYSISKAACHNLMQALRALLAGRGVVVHTCFTGPVDTDMTRGFEVPKSPARLVAAGIASGLERGDEDIFPDPFSERVAEGWRNGVVKILEREFRAFVPSHTLANVG
ncbi:MULTISPECIES: SDR family NAD(P)-dependent oxidoreductase [Rhizobium]|uniref:NAD(P)-dependent dehydrogenase (Short-subunit alcohol dehydrogenase family) n=1 Tax=Rhizobium tropici TaxID=398 RepID=A0A6P1CAM1_RHITR|nr:MULTISPECIES: SDR family NAD(P)-dependent oxidoreductase [Rhizobium]AGB73977.1 short-chain dehydrogenase/reductase [Rhizobium tropici CIAT 899]MBB4240461.1 NAD(P)-dependent dehydrogenase (short-subunit alcohol dehydrogenase family) [Rhizobium tropici]MBB5592123.1 NAD(P)-dependent dehydrogenase (short-subunit alcohol dehydrogenase family) [Rhizobium tropici]MBB6491178.1 NAD(P)-dependent dehydrogenase (short-subunit alcohol dehydrogenase family) [Rhizobium tropici]NEV14189.1 SDR family NAD(P)